MEGLGGHSSHVERRGEAPDLAALLQSISAALIRSPHHLLGGAIEGALAEWGRALAADRALVATRESGRFVQHHCWERGHTNGRKRSVPSGAVESLLGRFHLEHTLACDNRKQFAALRGAGLPDRLAAGIFVPVHGARKLDGVLAVVAGTPRSWPADSVAATERLADLLAASLDRMSIESPLAREQEGRLHAEAETRRLRDQLAHTGRVSMLGELAASLAHELNQPLTAIYTNAQAAHRFLDRKRPALGEARGALNDLGQDCRRAGDVLGRLRQMFRRHETERQPLAVGPLIEHVLRLLHEDAVARNVDVVLDVAPRLPVVNGDRVQLEQVVMNLVVNAFDAVTGTDGPREVTVRASARDGRVQLAVLDNGKGIARSELERIFEPFFSRKPNGMGMGLAICRTIVEAHGGRIFARNRPERGSVFEVNLPGMTGAEATQERES
jgi:signal transduction histidine kinase